MYYVKRSVFRYQPTILLMSAGTPKIKKLIHMGTSEIYGIQKKLPFNVNEKPNPMSPYGVL